MGCLTYLPKMNLFAWTVFLPEGFENDIIQRFLTGNYLAWGSISLFLVFSKKKILWKLWLWFSKKFHHRDFSDWIWRISKFPFWRQILDIYRQPLLNSLVFMNYEWVKFEIKEKGKPEYTEKNLAEWGRKPTTAGIEPKSHCRKTRLVLLPLNTTTITNCYYYY